MKPVTLILMLVFPVAVIAQEQDPRLIESRPIATSVRPEAVFRTANVEGVFVEPSPSPGVGRPFPQATKASRQTSGQAQPGSQQPRRPRPEGSMVGYIDNAVVGSQIRIRFDGGFDNPFPDRAEFFYAKCGCYTGLAGVIPQAFDPNASGPGSSAGVPQTLNFQQLYVDAEYAPHPRFSFSVEFPVRWFQIQGFQPIPPFPAFSNQSGLGDVRVGFKAAMVASEDRDVTFQLRAYVPSGDASKGMGTDHSSLEPALLYHQKVSQRAAVESQIGAWLPIGGNAGVPTAGSDKFSGKVFFYGIGPSYEPCTTSMSRSTGNTLSGSGT